ncbi:hypothetical protein ACSWE9_005480, partial [Escherichia coli]
ASGMEARQGDARKRHSQENNKTDNNQGSSNQSQNSKRLARTVLIFTERSDQLSRATDRVPGLPASPGYAQ